MNDNDICVSIILRYLVNINNFVKWYRGSYSHDYKHYCDEYLSFDLSAEKLDDFSFNFLVACFIWRRIL